jgi:heme oxygenase
MMEARGASADLQPPDSAPAASSRTTAGALDARHHLREATREDHRRVDELPGMRRLMSASVCRDDYVSALRRLLLLHERLLADINAGLGPLVHEELRPDDLMHGLCADLAALGETGSDLPVGEQTRSMTPWQALGAWYVIEGAALGGALIARNLRERLGDDLPTAHFAGRGAGRWPRFGRHLEAVFPPGSCETGCSRETALSEAVEGARYAFALSEAMLG